MVLIFLKQEQKKEDSLFLAKNPLFLITIPLYANKKSYCVPSSSQAIVRRF